MQKKLEYCTNKHQIPRIYSNQTGKSLEKAKGLLEVIQPSQEKIFKGNSITCSLTRPLLCSAETVNKQSFVI